MTAVYVNNPDPSLPAFLATPAPDELDVDWLSPVDCQPVDDILTEDRGSLWCVSEGAAGATSLTDQWASEGVSYACVAGQEGVRVA